MATYVLQTLQDPLDEAQEYPDELRASAQFGVAVCLKYSPCGNYIAVGILDGSLLIVDTDTLGVLRTMKQHVAPIRIVEWTPDSRWLLSAGDDWQCCLWDMASGELHRSVDVHAPVTGATLMGSTKCMASRSDALPVIVSFETGTITSINADLSRQGKVTCLTSLSSADSSKSEAPHSVVMGTTKGYIHIVQDDGKVVKTQKMCTGGIREVHSQGGILALNCLDRTVRTIYIPANPLDASAVWETSHKFNDNITHPMWAATQLSPSGKFILACADDKSCDVYIWTTSFGTLVQTLKGIVAPLFAVDFHPITHSVAGIAGDEGVMYIWTRDSRADWSNLIPDFIDMPQLNDYEEREDDFDIMPTVEPPNLYSQPVDIWTIDRPVTNNIMKIDL